MSSTYSFFDTALVMSHPLLPPFALTGEIGFHQAVVSMAVDKTVQDVASDGGVMVSAVAGRNGTVALEMQQTSELHTFLLGWLNLLETAMYAGNVAQFCTMTVLLRNLVDGSQHVCSGVSPSKMPDKTYTSQGQHITWTLHCADIINTSFPVL